MKLNMPLLLNERRIIFDWDARTYDVYYKDGSVTTYWIGYTVAEWPDEFLEWLPEQ